MKYFFLSLKNIFTFTHLISIHCVQVEYSGTEYISRPRRCELAERLQLSETQIKIWFQVNTRLSLVKPV